MKIIKINKNGKVGCHAIVLLLVVCMLSGINFSFASENLSRPPKGFNQKEIELNRKEAEKKDKWIAEREKRINKRSSNPEYYSISGYVDLCQQEKFNYCGPACIQQSLSFYKNTNRIYCRIPSQNEIAELVGTTDDGSWSICMKNVLNDILDSEDENGDLDRYVASDIECYSNPRRVFTRRIKNNLRTGQCPPIILVNLYELAHYYDDGVTGGRHYVSVIAYSGAYDNIKESVKYCDPHYKDKHCGKRYDEMINVYDAVRQADFGGDNKVMIY